MDLPFTPPYTGRIDGHTLISGIPAKVYFASILGREPEIYEWDHSAISQGVVLEGLERMLATSPHQGVPHIAVVFPHVTSVFRW
jgi:hypothetical protein